jgi:NADH:ubiquinone oxidoreductase subunit H
VPLAWKLWYRRLYYAAKNNGSIAYFWFFAFFLVHIGFSIWAAVGERRVLAAGGVGWRQILPLSLSLT